jgi:catechol 2,3-dioxygenase-like lactoylglutathione lyase family enzyme
MCPLLQVFNMPTALAFYRDILGFAVVADSGNGEDSSWVWLRLGDSDLMLNDQYEPGHAPSTSPSERVRWHDDVCLYFACEDPDAAYQELKQKLPGLRPPTTAPYGMRQLPFKDPDGYNVCLQKRVD